MDKWLETRKIQYHNVSAAGLVSREGRVLMIRSDRRGWEIPGGVVEQGETVLDGLKREIFEESGIIAVPKNFVGVYQNLSTKPGYGPLEGLTLPPTVNFAFLCDYAGGTETVSDESREVGWFEPRDALGIITSPYIRTVVRDLLGFDGRQFFRAFVQSPGGEIKFVSGEII